MTPLLRIFMILLLAMTGFYGLSSKAAEAAKSPELRHFVAFEFKESVTPAQVESVVTAFKQLKKSVPGVQSIEAGPNISPEHLNKGLTHAFLVTFASAKDRDTYLTHPEHEKFKAFMHPFVADVLVVDFIGNQ